MPIPYKAREEVAVSSQLLAMLQGHRRLDAVAIRAMQTKLSRLFNDDIATLFTSICLHSRTAKEYVDSLSEANKISYSSEDFLANLLYFLTSFDILYATTKDEIILKKTHFEKLIKVFELLFFKKASATNISSTLERVLKIYEQLCVDTVVDNFVQEKFSRYLTALCTPTTSTITLNFGTATTVELKESLPREETLLGRKGVQDFFSEFMSNITQKTAEETFKHYLSNYPSIFKDPSFFAIILITIATINVGPSPIEFKEKITRFIFLSLQEAIRQGTDMSADKIMSYFSLIHDIFKSTDTLAVVITALKKYGTEDKLHSNIRKLIEFMLSDIMKNFHRRIIETTSESRIEDGTGAGAGAAASGAGSGSEHTTEGLTAAALSPAPSYTPHHDSSTDERDDKTEEEKEEKEDKKKKIGRKKK